MQNELKWAVSIGVIVLLAFIVPYTLLRDVAKWSGSFLFWSICSLVVIGINYFLTRNWR